MALPHRHALNADNVRIMDNSVIPFTLVVLSAENSGHTAGMLCVVASVFHQFKNVMSLVFIQFPEKLVIKNQQVNFPVFAENFPEITRGVSYFKIVQKFWEADITDLFEFSAGRHSQRAGQISFSAT